MSALETLRQAANEIRGEWQDDNHTGDGRCKFYTSCVVNETHQLFADGRLALAVAAWLELAADRAEVGFWGKNYEPALAVARAYLGGE